MAQTSNHKIAGPRPELSPSYISSSSVNSRLFSFQLLLSLYSFSLFQHQLIELIEHNFIMVHKLTEEYANHGMSLKCDIYTANDYPKDAPVFLYFHPGGLVDGNRDLVAPWLVQVSLKR